MDSLLQIVGEEAQYFAALPAKVREQVIERHAAVAAVINAKRGTMVPVRDRFAEIIGVNPNTVSRWLNAYRRDGWRGLIDTRALPRTVGSRPRTTKA